jgi:hypothetical protein
VSVGKEYFQQIRIFLSGQRCIFFQTGLFIYAEETHEALTRKLSVLEAAAPSTLIPSENGVSF